MRNIKYLWSILAIGIVLFFVALYLYFSTYNGDLSIVHSSWGEFGSFITPFIALIAAILTFYAFYVQYKANNNQQKDIVIERFRDNFFKQLDIYRNLVNNLYLSEDIRGQWAFHFIFYELKSVHYYTTKNLVLDDLIKNPKIIVKDKSELIKCLHLYVAYEIVLSGLPVIKDYDFRNEAKDSEGDRCDSIICRRISKRFKDKFELNETEKAILEDRIDKLCRLLVEMSVDYKEGSKRKIYFFPTKIYKNIKYSLFYGWLPRVEPLLNQSCYIFQYLNSPKHDFNKNYNKQYKDDILGIAKYYKPLFIRQLTHYEAALIYSYTYFLKIEEFLDALQKDKNIDINNFDQFIADLKKNKEEGDRKDKKKKEGEDAFEEMFKERLKRYGPRFIWTDEDYLDTDMFDPTKSKSSL